MRAAAGFPWSTGVAKAHAERQKKAGVGEVFTTRPPMWPSLSLWWARKSPRNPGVFFGASCRRTSSYVIPIHGLKPEALRWQVLRGRSMLEHGALEAFLPGDMESDVVLALRPI